MNRIILFLCLASFNPVSFAQPGPGGIGDLTGTSELRLWVTSTSANVSGMNEPVDTLFDLSGAGNHLYAPSASARPSLVTDAINGYPVIRFDGVQQYLHDPVADTSFQNTEATLIAVVSRNSIHSFVSVGAQASSEEFLLFDRAVFHHSAFANFRYLEHPCTLVDSLTDHVITSGILGEAVDDIANYNFTIPSTEAILGAGSPSPYAMVDRDIYIGQRSLLQGQEYMEGDLVEVIGYNRKLAVSELEQVVTSLQEKYEIMQQCVPAGLGEGMERSDLLLYPDPVATPVVVNIRIPVIHGEGFLHVTDGLGRTCHSQRITTRQQLQLSLPDLLPGTYFITIMDARASHTQKLVVQ